MKMFLSIFAIITIFSLCWVATTAPLVAAGNLQVTNKDGIMYVTTENSTSSADTMTISTASGTVVGATIAPIKIAQGFAPNISAVINFALRLVIVVAVLLVFANLILGGIGWITSGGDKGKTEAARNRIVSAVIGLIILASSYAILTLAIQFLGFSDINSAISGLGTINSPGIIRPTPTPIATSSSQLQQLNQQ